MLDCKHTSQLVSRSLDKKLTFRERLAVKMHLMMCKYCRRFEKQLHAIRKGLKTLAEQVEHDETIQMPPEVKSRIAERIKHEQQ